MNQSDFTARLRHYPDEEVIRVALFGEEEGLALDAVKAAMDEAIRRGISNSQLAAMESEVSETVYAEVPHDDQELTVAARVLFVPFAFFLIIPAVIAAAFLSSTGYRKKAQQAWLSIAVGTFLILLLVIVMSFL